MMGVEKGGIRRTRELGEQRNHTDDEPPRELPPLMLPPEPEPEPPLAEREDMVDRSGCLRDTGDSEMLGGDGDIAKSAGSRSSWDPRGAWGDSHLCYCSSVSVFILQVKIQLMVVFGCRSPTPIGHDVRRL